MKKTLIHKWVLGGLSALALSSQAQTFQYNNGDVLIGFRVESGGTKDLVINAGPISGFTNLTAGTPLPITALTGAKLAAAFGTTNGLAWSASACFNAFAPVALQDTLFMSRPRAFGTQSSPWHPNGADTQDYVVGKIDNVGNGAVSIGSALAADPVLNTASSLVENESFGVAPKFSYYNMVKSQPLVTDQSGRIVANWLGTFSGNPEQYSDVLPARADFYMLPPGASSATYLGYFELSATGALVFHAGAAVVASQITGVQRTGTQTTVSFTTGASGTYTLLETTSLTPPLTWTPVSSVAGNGAIQSIIDTTTDSARFYTISVQ